MYKIAFDINGNDNGINSSLAATKEFLAQNDNFIVVLVGPEKEILSFYHNQLPPRVEIIDNSLVSKDVKNIRASFHEKTSMNVALELVANGQANAVLSSGDSGLYLANATIKCKRLEGLSRPAFMPLVPTIKGQKFLLLDVGANLEVKSDFLVEWAKVANAFAKVLLKVEKPRISLVNIGTEDYKGLENTKEAHQKLKNDSKLNYLGFIEPRELMNAKVDVAVIDGYGGNLVLKSLEGAMLGFKNLLKSKIMLKTIRKIGYLLLKGAFKDVAETLDYRNVGAAWVIGVNGVVIKSHGSSDQKAYLGALNQIKIALKNNVLNLVKEELKANEQ